jgi:hypothetical protein
LGEFKEMGGQILGITEPDAQFARFQFDSGG